MQVFLPFASFRQSVQSLDPTRLGNQIWRECKTLLNGGWSNHPVAKMWAPHRDWLALYALYGLEELEHRRAIKLEKLYALQEYFDSIIKSTPGTTAHPPFVGHEDFHRSHRLNLLWKGQQDVEAGKCNVNWYTRFFPEPVPRTQPEYTWPLSPQKTGAKTQKP